MTTVNDENVNKVYSTFFLKFMARLFFEWVNTLHEIFHQEKNKIFLESREVIEESRNSMKVQYSNFQVIDYYKSMENKFYAKILIKSFLKNGNQQENKKYT